MKYQLNRNCGDVVSVPQLVFSRLADVEDDWVRVALYIIGGGSCDEGTIAHALRLKGADKAKNALVFWKGVGLLENAEGSSTLNATQETPQIQRKQHLTTTEVATAANSDEAIAFLVSECQKLTGGIITQNDTNIFVSMYISDGMPIDMILLGVAHFTALGKRSARYIERALLSWQREGITTGADAEKYLEHLAMRESYAKRAAVTFGFTDESFRFSKVEQNIICDWFEAFNYDENMISEAISYAGDKKNVKYVNGILRKWNEKGFKTVRDVMQQSASIMQNIQVSNPEAKTVLDGTIRSVPVFKAGGDNT